MSQEAQKRAAATAAIQYVEDDMVIGVGTGSTVKYFIEALAKEKHRIEMTVSSSQETTALLKEYHIPVTDINNVNSVDLYVDGADECDPYKRLIKGGGAALTGEKIIRAVSRKFVCIVDESKRVNLLGEFPLPIEVIPLARSYVAREMVKLGGQPEYREGVVTDYGNVILDVYNLNITQPEKLEQKLNQITGVVTNGLFAEKSADIVLVASENGIEILK